MPSSPPHHFRDLLGPWSRLRYAIWRARKSHERLTVALTSGLRLSLRPLPATDYGVAYDIFLRQCYVSPRPLTNVKTIVDLGSNVGYSCLYWCGAYPAARVTAFEPHPVHVDSMATNLRLNGLAERVDVRPVAVGVEPGSAYLSDNGSSSTMNSRQIGYEVPVVDLFATVGTPIDILKIDIEGGEYSILGDERFGSLGARTVVVEWHRRGDSENDRAGCEQMLAKWGYQTAVGVEDLPLAGLVWGFR